MTTLYIDRRDTELRREGKSLVVFVAGARQRSLPLGLLERIVVLARTHLDSSLVTALVEHGVALTIVSRRDPVRYAASFGPLHNDARIRLAQCQRYADDAWRLGWSAELIGAKIRAHLRLYRRALAERPDLRKPLLDAIEGLEKLQDQAAQARALESLRGLEGAAARMSFAAYRHLLPASLGFAGRRRRPPPDPVNAALSLAYTLLHVRAAQAAVGAGLDPMVGYFHEPAFGRESLAADLIEPWRPRVDEWVWELFRAETLRGDHFSRHEEACLLGKAGRAVFYEAYEGFARPLERALRLQCRALVERLGVREEGEA